MKKSLLLSLLFFLPLTLSAAVININTSTSDALRLALNSAADGDEIVMAAGTYVESPSNYIAFSGKSVIVRAAEGAEVILKPHVPIILSSGARAEIRGIKIDASELCSVNSYSHLMYPSDNTANNRLILDGCEVYGYAEGKAVIASRSSNKLDSLIINNCKFYNHTTRSCVFLENTENKGLSVTNSTFYNIATGTESFGAGIIDERSTAAKVRVDHCTFYNVVAQSTDYAAIGKIKTSDAIVSNCIFAMPTSTDNLRAIRDVATANNCLTYNYTYDSNWGIHSSVTKNNCIQLKDPLFTNAASGDFSLAGDWTTMSISPARYAGTDGSHLGDPRWHSAETLPSTDFAPSYIFLGTKALLSGSFALNGDNYIQSQDKTYAGIATWKIEAERKCIVEVTLNIAAANTSGHRYEVALYDANNSLVGTALAEPSNSWSAGDKVMGTFEIPAAGNYTVKLTNDCANSSTIIEGVTFAYVGGAVQSMPCTTNINDAWFSSNGTRTAGEYISIPSGYQHEGWVKWNVSFASAAYYKVKVNIDNENGHNYTVALYRSESDESPISVGEGGQKGTIGTLTLGIIEVPAGNYIMKVTNATQYSDAKLISVEFEHSGGAVQNIADNANTTVDVSEAWYSAGGTREDSKIDFPDGSIQDGWVRWNVHFAQGNYFKLSVNIESSNDHLYSVSLSNSEGTISLSERSRTSAASPRELGEVFIPAGDYVMEVTNSIQNSNAKLVSVLFAPSHTSATAFPNTLAFANAALSQNAHVTNGMLYFNAIGDTNPLGEWARWMVSVPADGTFLFTMGVTSDNGQSYKITILDDEGNDMDWSENNPGSGDKTLMHYFYIPAGRYFVKVENTTSYSRGHLTSFAVTASAGLTTLDEAAADNSSWASKVNDPNTYDVQIIRTIVGGMYNTICLPFDVNSSQMKDIFGSDVVLKQLASATMDATTETLYLNFESVSSIYHGTPFIIKTSRNIVNPVFTGVEFKTATPSATTRTNANFIGTFIKGTITASTNNLFLGANDTFYFPTTNVEILGMRAYFVIHDVPAGMIKRARIVENEQTATGFDNLMEQPSQAGQKIIENGQLYIMYNGQMYNVQGLRVK